MPELEKDGSIQNVLKAGQEVLVQIVKEPISTKGPRLTGEISFAGRYLVLMPFGDKVSVSSKIKSGEEQEIYTEYLQVIINAKLRNAIGHNDVKYDAISQQITYIPDPKDRLKSRTEYLLEFENEALHLFQAILVIAEYLYKIKEFALIDKGHRPAELGMPSKKLKTGRNDLCPCGSGKKFKKCCLGKGLYD